MIITLPNSWDDYTTEQAIARNGLEEAKLADSHIRKPVYSYIMEIVPDVAFATALTIILAFEGFSSNRSNDSGGMTYMGITKRHARELSDMISSRRVDLDQVILYYYKLYLNFSERQTQNPEVAMLSGCYPPLSALSNSSQAIFLNDLVNPPYMGSILRQYYHNYIHNQVIRNKLPGPLDGSVNKFGKLFAATRNNYVISGHNTKYPFYAGFLYWTIDDLLPWIKKHGTIISNLVINAHMVKGKPTVTKDHINRAYAIISICSSSSAITEIKRLSFVQLRNFRDKWIREGSSIRQHGSTKLEDKLTWTKMSLTEVPRTIIGNPYPDISNYVMIDGKLKAHESMMYLMLTPFMKRELYKLAKTVFNMTGKRLYLKDGYRSWQEQQRLKDKERAGGNSAATPSLFAVHQLGLAIDIHAPAGYTHDWLQKVIDDNDIALHRDVYNRKRKEHWHYVPIGVLDYDNSTKQKFAGLDNDGYLRPDYQTFPAYKIS